MGAIIPIVRTRIVNQTGAGSHFVWYPPNGIYLEAGEPVTVDGDLMSLADDAGKQALDSDLATGRIGLSIEVIGRGGVVQVLPAAPAASDKEAMTADGEPLPGPAPAAVPTPKPPVQRKRDRDRARARAEVNPFKDVIVERSVEDMKPPLEDLFGRDWVAPPIRRADVPVVDLLGEQAYRVERAAK